MGRSPPARIVLAINEGECLPIVIADDEARCRFLDGPRRTEAAGLVGHGQGNLPSGHRKTISMKAIAKIRTTVAPVQKPRSIGM
jgi:hypothetical protein